MHPILGTVTKSLNMDGVGLNLGDKVQKESRTNSPSYTKISTEPRGSEQAFQFLLCFCAVSQKYFYLFFYYYFVSSSCIHMANGHNRLNKCFQIMFIFNIILRFIWSISNSHNWLQQHIKGISRFVLRGTQFYFFFPIGAVHLCSAEITPVSFLSVETIIMSVLLNDDFLSAYWIWQPALCVYDIYLKCIHFWFAQTYSITSNARDNLSIW